MLALLPAIAKAPVAPQQHRAVAPLTPSAPTSPLSSRTATGAALTVAAVSSAIGLRQKTRRAGLVARRVSRKVWNERVKRIEDFRAVFDVVIEKPLGLVPRDFPNRPGVGIAKINKDGNTDKLNRRVLFEDFDSNFVLEGDEVIAVNGIDCERMNLDFVGPVVKSAEGDSITLTLCRNYQKGPVKVAFLPGEEMITMTRGSLLRKSAEAVGADVRYRCKDGWCSSCWHTEDTSDLVHRICKFPVPKDWDSVKPLILLRGDYALRAKGLLVKNMMQADGYLPPPPLGVNVKAVRKDVEENNIIGL